MSNEHDNRHAVLCITRPKRNIAKRTSMFSLNLCLYQSPNVYNDLITSKQCSSSEVYSMEHFVIKFVNETDCHDIAEIWLKVALNTIALALALI